MPARVGNALGGDVGTTEEAAQAGDGQPGQAEAGDDRKLDAGAERRDSRPA